MDAIAIAGILVGIGFFLYYLNDDRKYQRDSRGVARRHPTAIEEQEEAIMVDDHEDEKEG